MRRRSTAALLIASCCLSPSAWGQPLFPLGGQFQVNSFTPNSQLSPEVATLAGGGFVVVWSSIGSASDPASHSVQGQVYDAIGAAVSGQFQANAYTTGNQSLPVVAADASGGFLVVWMTESGSTGTDTDGY